MNRNNRENRKNEGWGWLGAAAAIAGAAAAVGGAYYLATRNTEGTNQRRDQSHNWAENDDYEVDDDDETYESGPNSNSSYFNENTSRFASFTISEKCGEVLADETIVKDEDISRRPYICNLNTLLADIYDRRVALKDDDFQLHYKVFNKVFQEMHSMMKTVDKYYERYSSNVQFAGSHYNRIKIKKPDEFDVDIVIRLPVSMDYNAINKDMSDIIIEPKYPGFVQLRAGEQYRRIPYREDSHINKTAYSWLDDRNYILRSKFMDWFKGVASRALNNMCPCIYVDSVGYTIRTSSSGPAFTIILEAPGFRLDVDLVPALRFPESRWPVGNGYRNIPVGCNRGYWMVVPKPNKDGQNDFDENRSWRIALQEQENKMFYNTDKMRKVICLLKYIRDSQNMNKIASYYITTLFLNELIEIKNNNPAYWSMSDMQDCFIHMINKFQKSLNDGKIPYFWNKNHNLIGNLNTNVLNEYKNKINKIHVALQDPRNYKYIAKCILSPEVYAWYEKYL